MSNTSTITGLLDNVIGVLSKYEPIHRAQRFNIFSILRHPHEEVALHSRFIAELLDPNGTHEHGPEFLSLFLALVDSQYYDRPRSQSYRASVAVEQAFSSKDGEGRIDIFVQSAERIVVIENKIYAADQTKQLDRYYDFAKEQSAIFGLPLDPLVCYLTLWGDEPDTGTWSKGTNHSSLRVLSYSDIRDWLDQCLGLVALEPQLRETIHQYQLLIDTLTGNTMSEQEKQETVSAIMRSSESIRAANAIYNAWYEARTQGILEFWSHLESKLKALVPEAVKAESLDFQKYSYDKAYDLVSHTNKERYAYHGIMLGVGQYHNGITVCLYVEVDPDGLIYGITLLERQPDGTYNREINDQDRFTELREEILPEGFARNEWWLGWAKLSDVPNIGQPQTETVLDLMLPEKRDEAVRVVAKQVERLAATVSERLAKSSPRNRK